jgi:aspartyl-tRNA(Asn)/glutamyl-tRNA(Gln) amidotransferase subunit A
MATRTGDVSSTEPADLGLAAARALLDARALSCVELLSSVVARLEATEPVHHAYAATRLEAAFDEARALDRGHGPGGPDGALRGIPFAAKDVFCTKDLPTEAGSRVLSGFRPGTDAVAVARARDAGGVLVGKLVTHEFACGQDVPPTRSAWNPAHYPGGSTAGGGVAVALGSALAAFGSDSAGSVRKPAALNGVAGYKPTFGALSTAGVIPLSPSCDHVGIIARTVDDCGLLATVAAGGAGAEPRPRPAREPVSLRGRRLGLAGYFTGAHVDPGVQQVFGRALDDLRGLGAEITEVPLGSLDDSAAIGFTIIMAEAAAVHAGWLRTALTRYHPGTRRFLELASLIPGQHVELARAARRALTAEMAAAFRAANLDALVMPTVPLTSMPVADMDIGRDLATYIRHTLPANLTGQPAITVPGGLTGTGLPVGVQFAGVPGRDGALLDLARSYETATGWWRRSSPKMTEPVSEQDTQLSGKELDQWPPAP